MTPLIRDTIRRRVEGAVEGLIASGTLPEGPRIPVEISDTKTPEHGDYACNFALTATRSAGMPPRKIAELLSIKLGEDDGAVRPKAFEAIEVAGPGFLNFRLASSFIAGFVPTVLELGLTLPSALAHEVAGDGGKINVEFVSVNPNGPITVGSGRGAAFGDALVRVFRAAGLDVDGEYYINDGVNSQQMRLFAESVRSYALKLPFPDDGYKGAYVKAVAKDVARKDPGADLESQPISWWQAESQELMLQSQRRDLELFGVEFDTWFSEQSMHDSGLVSESLGKLKKNGAADDDCYRAEYVFEEKERILRKNPEECGPLWLRATRYGDDKDRVLLRTDGRPAYIAGDVAYMESKLGRRGYRKSYIILGPDHHGYIPRMNAVCMALGYPQERFEIVIFQIVRFLKDGKPAPMRKRDGNIYELRDLITEIGAHAAPHGRKEEQLRIGRDVSRFFYLMRSHETHMDFDIDLATKQSDENPVFYAQYAHARICGVLARGAEVGITERGDATRVALLLEDPREMALIKKILDLPAEVQRCARDYGVHRLTTYAVELARTYHHFYDGCRVVQPDQPDLTLARLALCRAAQIGLRLTFELLGISAPERMERETVPNGPPV